MIKYASKREIEAMRIASLEDKFHRQQIEDASKESQTRGLSLSKGGAKYSADREGIKADMVVKKCPECNRAWEKPGKNLYHYPEYIGYGKEIVVCPACDIRTALKQKNKEQQ